VRDIAAWILAFCFDVRGGFYIVCIRCAMKFRRFGGSGLRISVLRFGAAIFEDRGEFSSFGA